MANLHPKYKVKFLEEKLRLENRTQGFPFDLKFAHLASTMDKWAVKFGLDLPGRITSRSVNTLDDDLVSDDEETVNYVGKTKDTSTDCSRPGHTSETCDVNINYVLAWKNIANKPQVAKTIETTQTKYIRRPTSTRRPNSHFKQRREQRNGVQSGGRKGSGQVTKVSWTNEADAEHDHEGGDDDLLEEGVE